MSERGKDLLVFLAAAAWFAFFIYLIVNLVTDILPAIQPHP